MTTLLCRLLARLVLPLLAVLDEAHAATCEDLHRSPAVPSEGQAGCGTGRLSPARAASTSSARLLDGR